MLPYYYLIFTFRRWVRASEKDDIREWKARLILLWLQIYTTMGVLSIFGLLPRGVNPILIGIVVTAPFLLFNQKALSNKKRWAHYSSQFAKWAPSVRFIADAGVVLIVVLAFIMPFVLRSLTSNLPWWK